MEALHSVSTSRVLETGTLGEIIEALQALWASPTVQAQASTSFLVKLQPGTVIKKIDGGFQVGNSILREMPSLSMSVVGKIQWAVNAVAANDSRFTLAA